MQRLVSLMNKLVPELMPSLTDRYALLSALEHLQPAGRRSLAHYLDRSERSVRADIQALRHLGLLDVTPTGVVLSTFGEILINETQDVYHMLREINVLSNRLKAFFPIQEVTLVAGNADRSLATKRELGRAASMLLLKLVQAEGVVAVSGGTTLAAMADALPSQTGMSSVTVVPTRGGLGEELATQANTVASTLAQKLGCRYHPLYVAENLSVCTINMLAQEEHIKNVMVFGRRADICFHGIGEALTMAAHRRLKNEIVTMLKRENAKAEVFGNYLNEKAEVMYTVPSLGLHLEDLHHIPVVVAVAGGYSKADAIAAVLRGGFCTHLITDEAAAMAMLGGMP